MLRDVSSEAQEGGLRAFINVDREKAGRLGMSMQSVNDTLNDAFGQRQISTIYGQANQYRVILEARRNTSATRPRCEDLRRRRGTSNGRCDVAKRAARPTPIDGDAGRDRHPGAAGGLRRDDRARPRRSRSRTRSNSPR